MIKECVISEKNVEIFTAILSVNNTANMGFAEPPKNVQTDILQTLATSGKRAPVKRASNVSSDIPKTLKALKQTLIIKEKERNLTIQMIIQAK